jgi:hypothetical protein
VTGGNDKNNNVSIDRDARDAVDVTKFHFGDECPTCGQTFPPPFKMNWRAKRSVMLLIEAVYRAGPNGITSDKLYEKLYGDDPEGGPVSGIRSLHVRICHTNRRLREEGWLIVNCKGKGFAGVYGAYTLRKLTLPPVAAAQRLIKIADGCDG